MKPEFEYITLSKLSEWAENLPDDIDFIDYWFHLMQSEVLQRVEGCITNNINAFEWTRWRNDFEAVYTPQPGEGYDSELRYWYGGFCYELACALQTLSCGLATHYSKQVYEKLADKWYQYHTFGTQQAVNRFIAEFGAPVTPAAPS